MAAVAEVARNISSFGRKRPTLLKGEQRAETLASASSQSRAGGVPILRSCGSIQASCNVHGKETTSIVDCTATAGWATNDHSGERRDANIGGGLRGCNLTAAARSDVRWRRFKRIGQACMLRRPGPTRPWQQWSRRRDRKRRCGPAQAGAGLEPVARCIWLSAYEEESRD